MFVTRFRLATAVSKATSKFRDPTVLAQDAIKVSVRGGTGGQGLARYNGVGGDGGDVYVIPRRNLRFSEFFKGIYAGGVKKKLIAENGKSSTQLELIGRHGEHLLVNVPLGTECVDEETRRLVARCTVPNQKVLIARGGKGGCAANLYKGQKGDSYTLGVHLRLQPNIGLVGFPNAGKSTMLQALAPKKKNIKVAPYPFTTTRPQMLHVDVDRTSSTRFGSEDDERFTLTCADLPGLVEGASQNRGKGHSFLKHLQLSDMLLMVVDVAGFMLSTGVGEHFRTPLESIALLNRELEDFDPKLARKPVVLALNKVDLEGGFERANAIKDLLEGRPRAWSQEVPDEIRPRHPIRFRSILTTSAKNHEIGNLKSVLARVYDDVHPVKTLNLTAEFDGKNVIV